MDRLRRLLLAAALVGATFFLLLTAGPGAQEKEPRKLSYIEGYKSWKRVTPKHIFSESHGKRWILTYVNKVAEEAAAKEKFPFPPGSVIVKDSFRNQGGKPGQREFLFVMKKEDPGSQPEAGDWYWAIATPDFRVLRWRGRLFEGYGGNVDYCIECHVDVIARDYYYGLVQVSPERLKKMR
ncbi:MAG: cytochrome P460 family protein [Nitrospinota bacterium]